MKRIVCISLCFLCLFSLLSLSVSADTGPKAAVHIRVEGLPRDAYATLLSEKPSTGPNSAWDGDEDHIYNYDLPLAIWQAFQDYEDEDGYYFLQIGWELAGKNEFTWGYYPPNSFKVLLYFPETDSYAVSDICERYAFDTYYTVKMTGTRIDSSVYDEEASGNERIEAYRTYQFWREFRGFAFRVLLTVLIEIGIAFLFGIRAWRAILLLFGVNLLTQLLLFFGLNLVPSIGMYILLEFAIFAAEALAYFLLQRVLTSERKPLWFFALYSFVANLSSFLLGLLLAEVLSDFF